MTRSPLRKEALRRWLRDRRVRWILVAMSPMGFVAVLLGEAAFPAHTTLRFAAAWVFLIVVMLASLPAILPRYVRHLRCIPRERGYEVCLKCGNAFKGLGTDVIRCPECGAPIAASHNTPIKLTGQSWGVR